MWCRSCRGWGQLWRREERGVSNHRRPGAAALVTGSLPPCPVWLDGPCGYFFPQMMPNRKLSLAPDVPVHGVERTKCSWPIHSSLEFWLVGQPTCFGVSQACVHIPACRRPAVPTWTCSLASLGLIFFNDCASEET